MSLDLEYTDAEIVLMLLQDNGASRAEALEALAFSPEMVGRLAPAIASKRAQIADRLAAAEQEAYAASLAGRADAARDALKRQAERDELVAGAKALLMEQGVDPEGLTDVEVLHATEIEPQVSMLSREALDREHEALAARWRSLSPLEQALEASRLNIESASVERYVRVMEGNDEPVSPAWHERAGNGAEAVTAGDGND